LTSTAISTTTPVTTATSTRATTARARTQRKGPRAEFGARALVLLLACTTFLFAGSYTSSLVIPALIVAVLAAGYRPWGSGEPSTLHTVFFWIAAAMAVQLVPLPAGIVDLLSPADRRVWQALSMVPVRGPLPLSTDLAQTVRALGVGGGALLVFVLARQIFLGGGVRIAARGIATIGLVLAAVSLAQDATARGLIYWRWYPGEGAPPFGPFLNRNHFATWMVIAIPLCLGYLMAHTSVHQRNETPVATWQKRLMAALDARSLWLAASICLMLVGLVACLSRSGIVGLVSALLLGAYLRGRRTGTGAMTWGGGALVVALGAAAFRGSAWQIFERFGAAGSASVYRMNIWRATAEVAGDFWLTGSGAGTLATVMLVYQRAPSLFRINSAHNHYLQVAAEGGLLVGIPVAVALALFVRASRDALVGDDSGMYFLRAGAVSGLFGVAVQSIWEVGLTTPANAVLAALAAGIAVHRSAARLRPEA
jgi:O-Antigen ligase